MVTISSEPIFSRATLALSFGYNDLKSEDPIIEKSIRLGSYIQGTDAELDAAMNAKKSIEFFLKQDMDKKILHLLELPENTLEIGEWEEMVKIVINPTFKIICQ